MSRKKLAQLERLAIALLVEIQKEKTKEQSYRKTRSALCVKAGGEFNNFPKFFLGESRGYGIE